MFGIIIAVEEEIKIKKNSKVLNNNPKIYQINNSLILAISGIGKTNAALTTQLLISKFNCKKIINIGSCCALNKGLIALDVVWPALISYGDVDLTGFNYATNQIPKAPLAFKNSEINIVEKKLVDSIQSLDSFVSKWNLKKFHIFETTSLIDMESAAIAHVCYINNVECSIIKIVSDCINKKPSTFESYNKNITTICDMITNLVYLQIAKQKNAK